MFEWWNSLGITMQVFYCIAIPATLIIVIQTILLMIGIGHGGEGVEFSDTSGIDGLGDVPDMPADVPADIPTDMTAHAIEGCDHMTTGDGSNPADFGTMQLFTLQGIMTFLCVFGWTGIISVPQIRYLLSTVKSEATRTVRQEAQSAYTAVRHSLCPSSSRISLWT